MGFLQGALSLNVKAGYIDRCAFLFLILFAFAAFGTAGSAAAGDDSWSIAETKGDVQVLRAGFQPIALTDGVTLHPGDRIVTSGSGRAVLTRGEDTIIVAPNSEMGLPALKRPGWGTRIIQEIGTIFLKVETAAERRFEVETPVLAAVVKGTRFTVTANPLGAAVHVLEGAVEVSAFESQQTGLVMPGQTARLDSSPGSRLQIDGNDAPRANKAKSFERTIKTDEPEADKVTVPGAPEVKEASLGGGDGGSDGGRGAGQAIGRQLTVDRVSAVELKSEPAEGAKAAPRLKAQVTPKAIKVALGDTDVDLRKVTRGLVRNVVVQRQAGKSQAETEEKAEQSPTKAQEKTRKADRKAQKAAAKAAKIAKVEAALTGLGELSESDQGRPAERSRGVAGAAALTGVASLQDRLGGLNGELGLEGADGAGAPTGIGLEGLSTAVRPLAGLSGGSGFGGTNGAQGTADVATGIGDLPSGLADLTDVRSSLRGDGGAPTGAGNIGGVQDAIKNIQDVQKDVGGAKALKLGAD